MGHTCVLQPQAGVPPKMSAHNLVSAFLRTMFKLTYGVAFKVGTHEGTSRRDLFKGLVRCRVYTMGQVAGTSPLKGLHAGTSYTSK